jgi:transposase
MPRARVLVAAQRHGVSPSLVYRWRREAAGRPVRKARPRAPRFVPLLVDGDGLAKAPMVSPEPAGRDAGVDRIEILLRNGRVMRVGIGTDAAAVARLASALEA